MSVDGFLVFGLPLLSAVLASILAGVVAGLAVRQHERGKKAVDRPPSSPTVPPFPSVRR